jgi:hypothetical protein
MNSEDEDPMKDFVIPGGSQSGHDQAWLEAMNMVGQFLESDDIREVTELTKGERLVISMMEGLADDPFPYWRPGGKTISSKPLQKFITAYDIRGKSLNRGFLGEAVQIFQGIFQGLKDSRRRGDDSGLLDNVLK